MRKIIGGAFVSLDGVMQAPGGPEEDRSDGFALGGWLANYFEEAVGNQVDTLLRMPFDLLLGRRTYDIFASYWPFQPQSEDGDGLIAATFAKVHKFVLTSSDAPLEWQGSHRLASLDALAALKQEDGPNLVIQGSSTLYPQLLERGLLDRIVLMISPLTLGAGKRLFGEGTPPRVFQPVEQRIGPRGTIIATYEPAGQVEPSTFETQPPSEKELARRARVESGNW